MNDVVRMADDQAKGSHTPGPWNISKEGYIGCGEYGNNPVVAKVAQFFGPGDRQRYESDQRLIAAAPDLLLAVKVAENELTLMEREFRAVHSDTRSVALPMLRAAIAKAEGRS